MGYLPKHIKVKRHRWNMRIIATAALSGCMFLRNDLWRAGGRGAAPPIIAPGWCIEYPDGGTSQTWMSKGDAAYSYLSWYFYKMGVKPRRRIA